MSKGKKSICIISFSPIYRDARVLRQIKYLSTFYNLTIIGYGQPHPYWVGKSNIKWISVDPSNRSKSKLDNLKKFFRPSLRPKAMAEYLVMFWGRLRPSLYETWFWRKRQHIQALKYASEGDYDAILANDWNALPVAAEASRRNHAKLVFDAHEYAPLELENRWYWRILFQPVVIYFLKKYVSQVSASLTVAPLISERYRQEFGLNPIVILNVPEKVTLPDRQLDFDNIRLVHHGGAIRDRRLEDMIKTLAYCERRFTLHFMLIDSDKEYVKHLRRIADETVPGRVVFHEPLPPEEIVQKISEYDIGFCLIAPTNYNYLVSLPNKFFDYMIAGLAICIGPSPSMAEFVHRYSFGRVAPSFDPKDIAEVLNRMTRDDLLMMRLGSKEASERINAEIEMGKLVELCDRVMNSSR